MFGDYSATLFQMFFGEIRSHIPTPTRAYLIKCTMYNAVFPQNFCQKFLKCQQAEEKQ